MNKQTLLLILGMVLLSPMSIINWLLGRKNEQIGTQRSKNKCSVCGHKFIDGDVSGDRMFLDYLAQKGLECESCGRRYCMQCWGKLRKAADGIAQMCKCGSTNIVGH
ncbi:MAG: hypothetical protein WBW16_03340 [Bacteroidota bacterium]